MDTKLMKSKLKNLMVFALVMIFVLVYTAGKRAAEYSTLQREHGINKAFFTELKKNESVNQELIRYARNLNRFYIYHRDYNNIPDDEKVSEEDILRAISNLESDLKIQQELSVAILNSVLFSLDSTAEEKDQAIIDFNSSIYRLNAFYNLEIELIQERLINEIKSNYDGVRNYLDNTLEFSYYIKDLVLNEIFTNIPEEDTKHGINHLESKHYARFSVNLSDIDALFNGVPLNRSFSQNGIEGYIFVPLNQPVNSFILEAESMIFQNDQEKLDFWRSQELMYALLFYALFVVFIALFLAFIILLYRDRKLEFDFTIYRKIPAVIKITGIVLAIIFLKHFFKDPFNIFIHDSLRYITNFAYFIVISFMGFIFIYTCLYIIKTLKNISLIKTEPEVIFFKKTMSDFMLMRKYSPYFFPTISLLIFFGIFVFSFVSVTIILNSFYYNMLFALLTLVFFIVICLAVISLKIIINYSKLGFYINNISDGVYDDIPKESGMFAKLLNKLSNINLGFKKNLEKTLKSERMKTELITNVSHDLKTPLTSIINYVELLKGLELKEPEKEYAEVLAEKSHRLKVLIEDLFEAAKLSSSNIELNYNKVNIVQLIKQTIGELDEKIKKNNLDFKISVSSEYIPIMLDGQKMWRVFDNLIGNIIKYSKKDTRVYISIAENEKTVDIIMKNISSHELDFDASELFERFKRGDKSRTTEGSGLGLSIAKDIIDLHEGSLNISIDGDLFKSEIILLKND